MRMRSPAVSTLRPRLKRPVSAVVWAYIAEGAIQYQSRMKLLRNQTRLRTAKQLNEAHTHCSLAFAVQEASRLATRREKLVPPWFIMVQASSSNISHPGPFGLSPQLSLSQYVD